jgi:MSHA biogenesis protein MshN
VSLINKMLQDLDKRHAADGGGKTLTQQLHPVPARKDWRRIVWEIGAGLIIGGGWAVWVLYQISPRSVVTELAFQSQAKRLQVTGALQAPATAPAAQPAVATAPPAQAPATQAPPLPAMPAPATALSGAAPAVPEPGSTEPSKLDSLRLATEIAAPLDGKSSSARSKTERKSAAGAAPPAKAERNTRSAADTIAAAEPATASAAPTPGAGQPSKSQGSASIDKQPHVATPAERAESEFRKATLLLNQGRVAEAMDGYKSSLQQDARHAAARQALVGLLLENRHIDEAQQYLQEGLSLNPDRSVYVMLLARIQVERGDLQGAHDLLAKYAGGAANNADYHAFDAAVLQRLGRHKEAVSEYQAALALAPRAGLWWMGMGISLQADNRGTEALDAFNRAKSAGGLSPDLLAFVDQRMKQLQ